MKKGLKILILVFLDVFYKMISWIYLEKGVVVLMYHSISKNKGPTTVDPENFEKQLKYLKNNHYQFITLEELLGQRVGSKRVLITFDDGYKDLLTVVLPILKKINIPATAFIHTSRFSANLGNNFPLLNWEEIRELSQNGMAIGNHSHTHLDLKKFSPGELASEIKNSEEIFKKELGSITKVFAYPGGKYNALVVQFLRQHNYEMAFTIDEGVVLKNDDRFKLKRIGVGGEVSMLEFRLKLTRIFNWYQSLRKIFGLKK